VAPVTPSSKFTNFRKAPGEIEARAVKKKLLVILGAGSSVEQGFPIVADLNCEVASWARNYAASKGIPDYYDLLWKNRANYCSGLSDELNEVVEHRTSPNYERVLGDLQALMNSVLASPYGDPLLRWIAKADVFSGLEIVPKDGDLGDHSSHRNFHAIEDQLRYLCRCLANKIRMKSRDFEADLSNEKGKANFEPYKQLFAELSEEFDVGVYNLNYDTVALNALPDPFVGFDKQSGQFRPSDIFDRNGWSFLYHLHGSIHHRIRVGSRVMENPGFGPKITWCGNLSQALNNEIWEDTHELATRSDEKRVLFTTLISGGWKLDQLQEEPFQTLYSCLPRHAYEADAILIGGYGFGDSHISSALTNALRSKAGSVDRPPIIVLGYDKDKRPFATRNDAWANAMSKILRVSACAVRAPSHHSVEQWTQLIGGVVDGEFEQLREQPFAIWNDGFVSACKKKTDQMVKWLSGDSSALSGSS